MEQWWDEKKRESASSKEAASILVSFLLNRGGDLQATEKEEITKVSTYLKAELGSGQHLGKSPKKKKKDKEDSMRM